MALFGGQRDMDLFNKVNKELITDIVDTEVYYYMLVVTDTKANLYGEGKDKVFHNPIKVPALVERNQAAQISDEFGQSYSREVQFRFLRQQLVDRELVPEVGDIIQWNNEYHLIDASYSYQYFAGKNPKYWDGGDTQGLNVSIICDTHVSRQTSIKLAETRFGNSNQNDNEVPIGL
jgi:hypothetical protein